MPSSAVMLKYILYDVGVHPLIQLLIILIFNSFARRVYLNSISFLLL